MKDYILPFFGIAGVLYLLTQAISCARLESYNWCVSRSIISEAVTECQR